QKPGQVQVRDRRLFRAKTNELGTGSGQLAASMVAFIELQQKMLETTHKLKMADVQIDGLKRSIQHAQLTDKEISLISCKPAELWVPGGFVVPDWYAPSLLCWSGHLHEVHAGQLRILLWETKVTPKAEFMTSFVTLVVTHEEAKGQEMVGSLDPDTRTYESVGRMFILTDVAEVREHLQKKAENWSDKIKTLENNKSYLERSLKDSENNIREMVQQKKDAAEGN
ncbi:unnamed protein product, partial [Timema podura]|nr:unnamed protein product [Timema podura]